MSDLLLPLARRIARTAIATGTFEDYGFRLATIARKYFARHAGGHDFQTTFDGGTRVWVNLSNHLEAQVYFQGMQREDRGELRLMDKLLQPDWVFFDIGANVGMFSLFAAKRAREVHAFEPSQKHIERFQRNIALNGFTNIVVNPVGVSDQPTTGTLYVPTRDMYRNVANYTSTDAASLFGEGGAGFAQETVTLITLDDYVRDRQLTRLDLLKIDIEGAELDALAGGRASLERFRPQVIMEVRADTLERAGRTPAEVFAFWQALGYTVQQINASGGLSPVDPAGTVQNIYCRP